MQIAIACPSKCQSIKAECRFGMQGRYQLSCDRNTFALYNSLLWYCRFYGTRRVITQFI